MSLVPKDELPHVNVETGCPESVVGVRVVEDPEIVVYPQLLSDEECEHLVGLAEGCWQPSMDITVSRFQEMGEAGYTLSESRTSWTCKLRPAQTQVLDRIERRLADIVGMPVEHLEPLNMVRYAPGEFFGVHQDGGQSRPKTAFVYLNELPADDAGGDTFFPRLGICLKARRGTAVRWPNRLADGQDDQRTQHGARAPAIGIKYGMNCFFNQWPVRCFSTLAHCPPLESLRAVDVRTLGAPRTVRVISQDPRISAVAEFLSAQQVQHIRELAASASAGSPDKADRAPLGTATRTLRVLEPAETDVVHVLETQLAFLSAAPLAHLCPLRVVRPSSVFGYCNRGVGLQAAYVCLNSQEEVLFPGAGLRILLRAGDALNWNNIDADGAEDSRTLRMHVKDQSVQPDTFMGVDASVHKDKLRERQQMRPFVADRTVLPTSN